MAGDSCNIANEASKIAVIAPSDILPNELLRCENFCVDDYFEYKANTAIFLTVIPQILGTFTRRTMRQSALIMHEINISTNRPRNEVKINILCLCEFI